MANYGHILKPAPEQARGGYKNSLLVVQKTDITTWGTPTATPAVLGDIYTIAIAHAFATNKGYYEWACKTKSVVGKGAPIGDEGAQQVQYTYEAVVLGDSASTQEQMTRSLNDDLVFFVKD